MIFIVQSVETLQNFCVLNNNFISRIAKLLTRWLSLIKV